MTRGAGVILIAGALALGGCGVGGGGVTPIRTSFNKGVYHYSSAEYDEAIANFRRAVDENPDDRRAWFNLGLALESRAAQLDGEERGAMAARAEDVYTRTLERWPNSVRCAVNLAAIERERGDVESAERRLEEIALRRPDSATPYAALASLRLILGDAAGAEAAARKGLAIEPGSAELAVALGDALGAQGRRDDAARAYARAVEADGSNIAALRALGEIELERDNPESAVSALERALFIDPDNPAVNLALADAYERTDRLEAAAWRLWRAKQLAVFIPGASNAEEIDARLRLIYERLLARVSKAR